MSTPLNDAYGHTINFNTDGTTDTYLIGGTQTFSFPTGTPTAAALISMAIQFNLQRFMVALQVIIQTQFSTTAQLQFVCMYLAAQAGGLATRQAYIGQLLTWLNSIEIYAASYVATVQAMTDPSLIAATQIDSSQIPPAPAITMIGAIQILN